MSECVTCIKEYKLSIMDDHNNLWTFNPGEKFDKMDYDESIIYKEGYIRIDVEHLKIVYGKDFPMIYKIVIVPQSHFLTAAQLRDYNIDKIIE